MGCGTSTPTSSPKIVPTPPKRSSPNHDSPTLYHRISSKMVVKRQRYFPEELLLEILSFGSLELAATLSKVCVSWFIVVEGKGWENLLYLRLYPWMPIPHSNFKRSLISTLANAPHTLDETLSQGFPGELITKSLAACLTGDDVAHVKNVKIDRFKLVFPVDSHQFFRVQKPVFQYRTKECICLVTKKEEDVFTCFRLATKMTSSGYYKLYGTQQENIDPEESLDTRINPFDKIKVRKDYDATRIVHNRLLCWHVDGTLGRWFFPIFHMLYDLVLRGRATEEVKYGYDLKRLKEEVHWGEQDSEDLPISPVPAALDSDEEEVPIDSTPLLTKTFYGYYDYDCPGYSGRIEKSIVEYTFTLDRIGFKITQKILCGFLILGMAFS